MSESVPEVLPGEGSDPEIHEDSGSRQAPDNRVNTDNHEDADNHGDADHRQEADNHEDSAGSTYRRGPRVSKLLR